MELLLYNGEIYKVIFIDKRGDIIIEHPDGWLHSQNVTNMIASSYGNSDSVYDKFIIGGRYMWVEDDEMSGAILIPDSTVLRAIYGIEDENGNL